MSSSRRLSFTRRMTPREQKFFEAEYINPKVLRQRI
jgi:hypothetical protein